MTTTITPYQSPVRTGRVGFGRLLLAEWTKLRTVRGWWLSLIAGALLIILVGLLGTGAVSPSGERPDGLPIGPSGEAVNDGFYFVHQPLDGDGSITVPVTSLTGQVDHPDGQRPGIEPWSKAGIIVKENLTPGSQYAAVLLTGEHGVRMQHNYTGDIAAGPGRWLRLVRTGDTITGYNSADGRDWKRIGAVRLAGLPARVEVGLFAATPESIESDRLSVSSNPAVVTASFGTVGFGGQWRQGAWKGEQIGHAGTSGSYSANLQGGFTDRGDSMTITGAGDIAPVVGGPALGQGYAIETFVVGVFAAVVVLIVIATLFITAEYRRGLIRTTLTASPRRGRVLAAKAIVLGGVAFVLGIAAAAVMLPLGKSRARANGFHVLSVPSLTEWRVIVGTALLMAVTAVLALAVGTILRRSAVATAVVVAALVLPYLLSTASILPTGAAEWLLRLTPAAGFAIQQTVAKYEQVSSVYVPAYGYYPLPPWGGFGVLLAYTAAALGVAFILLRKRDA